MHVRDHYFYSWTTSLLFCVFIFPFCVPSRDPRNILPTQSRGHSLTYPISPGSFWGPISYFLVPVIQNLCLPNGFECKVFVWWNNYFILSWNFGNKVPACITPIHMAIVFKTVNTKSAEITEEGQRYIRYPTLHCFNVILDTQVSNTFYLQQLTLYNQFIGIAQFLWNPYNECVTDCKNFECNFSENMYIDIYLQRVSTQVITRWKCNWTWISVMGLGVGLLWP